MAKGLRGRILAARGQKPADLVLKNGRIVNVFSGAIEHADIAIHDGVIAGTGAYRGRRELDLAGQLVLPGLVDSHMHLESTLLSPAEFAKAALPQGTTAVVADPHEIANVLGKKGIAWLLDATRGLPLDFYFMLPSCVPASPLETSGARLLARDLLPFLRHPRVLGLAELMNFPGVLSGDGTVLEKLRAFRDYPVDGHAPGLSGKDLMAYAGAGITSDHECTTADEAREKARLGMTIFIREGSAARNLVSLLPAITERNSGMFCFATDDLQAGDLVRGGINLVLAKAIGLGLDPVTAVRMATLNPAIRFKLRRKGAIAPGYDADIITLRGFDSPVPALVIKEGKIVARDGVLTARILAGRRSGAAGTNSVKFARLKPRSLSVGAASDKVRVIELIPGQIETRQAVLPAPVRDGLLVSDPGRDLLKAVVVERHRATGNRGFGMVKGFGLKRGALASTVAHDSHNIIAIGVDDSDILAALLALRKLRGGMVVVAGGTVRAALPLPIAGLMTDRPAAETARRMSELEQAARDLGAKVDEPFSVLSFLALPVLPELKLTDRGLVDVQAFTFVNLFV